MVPVDHSALCSKTFARLQWLQAGELNALARSGPLAVDVEDGVEERARLLQACSKGQLSHCSLRLPIVVHARQQRRLVASHQILVWGRS